MHRDQILLFFAKYIEGELGIVYSEHNYFQLENRLNDIVKLLGYQNIEELYSKSQVSITGQAKQLILDLATNNETSFFRDPKVFAAIEELISKLCKNNDKIRIWSAASSTGQEAVSVALLVKELELKLQKKINLSIFGSDISDRVLQKAKSGEYTQLEVQRGLPAKLLVKYFSKTADDKWKVSNEILKNIEYKKLNLKDSFLSLGSFDIILCRNVLIYQTVDGKKDIIHRLSGQLAGEGILILGTGESMIGVSSDFEIVNDNGAVYYRKRTLMKQVG